ncbi:hypothetical protein [Mycobacterium heidelbergense]|nr:hypothetical protein [Mycobacterium heidelbergense]
MPHERPRRGERPDPVDAQLPAEARLAAAGERRAWVPGGQAVAGAAWKRW